MEQRCAGLLRAVLAHRNTDSSLYHPQTRDFLCNFYSFFDCSGRCVCFEWAIFFLPVKMLKKGEDAACLCRFALFEAMMPQLFLHLSNFCDITCCFVVPTVITGNCDYWFCNCSTPEAVRICSVFLLFSGEMQIDLEQISKTDKLCSLDSALQCDRYSPQK